MKNRVRVFLAVELSQEVRSTIERLVRSIRKQNDGVKWVETQSLHLTLKFFGEIPTSELSVLAATANTAARQAVPFDLELQSLGAFPNLKSPRTLWIGCRQGSENLIDLAASIEEKMFEIGYAKENRRFSPHLTIGRIKRDAFSSDFFSLLPDADQTRAFGSCPVGEIVLFGSELTSRGPVYTRLASAPLGNG